MTKCLREINLKEEMLGWVQWHTVVSDSGGRNWEDHNWNLKPFQAKNLGDSISTNKFGMVAYACNSSYAGSQR
jgi:hypothetical protein